MVLSCQRENKKEVKNMICPICGMEIENNSIICPICGYQVELESKETVNPLTDNICSVCGAVLESNDTVCPVCNAPIDNVEIVELVSDQLQDDIEPNNAETSSQRKKNATNKKRYLVILILFCLLIGTGIAGYFVIYPQITENIEDAENQKEAEKVVNLIDSLKDKEITADMEDELDLIRLSYNSLTKEQKKLVTNYDKFKKALESLEKEKEKLEKEQEQLEKQKAEQELLDKQKHEIKRLIYNFPEFYGKWGDFGIHVNKYQGLIESAIKSKISLSNYFSGSPNNVNMYASSFQWDGENIDTATCSILFDGVLLGTGEYGTLAGTVSVNYDGTLEFYVNYID